MDVALYAELDLGATGEGEKNGVRRVTLGKRGIKEEGRQYGSSNGKKKKLETKRKEKERRWKEGRRQEGLEMMDGNKKEWFGQ